MELLTVFVILQCLTQVSGLAYPGYPGYGGYLVPPKCPPCDAKSCPQLTFCAGKKVKDHCGCCPRCSSDLFQPHVDIDVPTNNQTQTEAPEVKDISTEEDVCAQRRCPKFQVCMVNQQGLPICTCPSHFVCKRGGRKRARDPEEIKLCGSDGITYESRCHMRIANCNSKKRIKRLHEGDCTDVDLQNVIGDKLLPSVFTVAIDNERNEDEDSLENTKRTRKKKRKKDSKGRKKNKNRKKKRRTRNERKDRKERKARRDRKRKKRTKRRNEILQQYAYPPSYGELIGRHTKWSSSQVRKSKI